MAQGWPLAAIFCLRFSPFRIRRMDRTEDITRLVEDTLAALQVELWGVEYAARPNNTLVRLYIDRSDREITIEDCEAVSREVAALFDVEDPIRGQYTLEVSSPGLDRPFFKAVQMQRFVGERVEATLHAPVAGRRRVQGELKSIDDQRIELDVDGNAFSFDFGQAAKIRVKPDYARLLGQAGRGRKDADVPGENQ